MFEPFVNDNALQVIVVAIFVGFIMLLLGDSVKGIKNIIDENTTLIYKMMSYVCKLIPVIVFLGIYNILANSQLAVVLRMYKMFILMFGAGFILVAFVLVKTSMTVKVPMKQLVKKMLPTLIINLTTSSQVSALPENMKCCKDKFGLDQRMVDFGLPLGIVTYMPVGSVVFVATIAGYFLPAFNGMLLQLLMLNTGKELDLIDYEKLATNN